MSALPLFREDPVLPKKAVMAKATLGTRKITRAIHVRTWEENFFEFLTLIESRWGQRAVLIEFMIRFHNAGLKEEGTTHGLVARWVRETLENSRSIPDSNIGVSPDRMRQIKEATVHFFGLTRGELRRPRGLVLSEREWKLLRWQWNLEQMGHGKLLETLVLYTGTCNISEYELQFLGGNWKRFAYRSCVNGNFDWSVKQRDYAERLLVGHPDKLPLIGLCRRERVLRLDQVRRFKTISGNHGLKNLQLSTDAIQYDLF